MASRARPLADSLVERIHKDHVTDSEAGTKLPAEDLLAGTYSVNRRTVRAALAELEKQGKVVRKPYRGVFVAGSYQADWYPYIGKTIGISFRQTYWTREESSRLIADGIMKAMYPTGMKLAFTTRSWRSMCQDHYPAAHYGTPEVIGMFHVGRWHDEAMASFLSLDVPAVAIDFDGTADNLDSFRFDNFRAGAKLAQQLLKLKHKRIALVIESREKAREWRDEAWQLRHAGMLSEFQKAELMSFVEIPMTQRGEQDQLLTPIKNLLKKPTQERPTALVLPFDGLDMVRTVAQDRGLKIPRDLTVMGYCEASQPSTLSGIRFDSRELGNEAAAHLLRKLTDPKWRERETVLTQIKGEYSAHKSHGRPRRR